MTIQETSITGTELGIDKPKFSLNKALFERVANRVCTVSSQYKLVTNKNTIRSGSTCILPFIE